MEIIFSDAAQKQIHKFKKTSAQDIEAFVQSELERENFQEYLDKIAPDIAENILYDRERKIMIQTEINSQRTTLEIQNIRKA